MLLPSSLASEIKKFLFGFSILFIDTKLEL